MAIKTDNTIPTGSIGLSSSQRAWIEVSLGETVEDEFVAENAFSELSSIMIEVKFLRKSIQVDTPFATEHMADSIQGNIQWTTICSRTIINHGCDWSQFESTCKIH